MTYKKNPTDFNDEILRELEVRHDSIRIKSLQLTVLIGYFTINGLPLLLIMRFKQLMDRDTKNTNYDSDWSPVHKVKVTEVA